MYYRDLSLPTHAGENISKQFSFKPGTETGEANPVEPTFAAAK
jgi:hypothetical protein